ncbi:hypothetical protein H5410_015228 [Solanum commersonii]|uniref:F-box domain-containing protein n=1 Tax=Solanum commersonii TaxID=4109 RepID=A0A9J5ZTS7_SOLCO|nr:hypothetical protein H5410_015228 [Solanum commersonii]
MDFNVAIDILSRLPMRSLLRVKCVSKLWMTLIFKSYFSMKHLNHVRNDKNSQKILVNQWYYEYEEFSMYCSSLSFNNFKVHFLSLLWNPHTRESIVLPYSKIFPRNYCTWRLDYDSTSDDYKILKIDEKSCSEILVLTIDS